MAVFFLRVFRVGSRAVIRETVTAIELFYRLRMYFARRDFAGELVHREQPVRRAGFLVKGTGKT
jgi:hypothetical protein